MGGNPNNGSNLFQGGGGNLAQSFMQNTATQPQQTQLPQITQPQITQPQAPSLPQMPQQPVMGSMAPQEAEPDQYVRMQNPHAHVNSIRGVGATTPLVGEWVPEGQVDMLRDRPGFWDVGNAPDPGIQSGPFAGVMPGSPPGRSAPSAPMSQPRQPSEAQRMAQAINRKAQRR